MENNEVVRYRTKFKLSNYVLDLDAAQGYLTEDDMVNYLLKELDDSCSYFQIPMSHLKDKILGVNWHLEDENSGYIELITTEEIPQAELNQISEWVRGQCSDGLGEGFEQQDFAFYEDEDDLDAWEDDEDCPISPCDDHWVMCSFDWSTNKYIFSRFNG